MNRFSTRLLLSATAIAVVCGLIIATTAPLHTILILTVPWAYGTLIALYFLPAAISLPLFKTPGIGILTAALTGIIVSISPLNNRGMMAFVYVILVGLLQEAPIAIARYKIWSRWVYSFGAVLAGVCLAIVFHFAFAMEVYSPWIQITQLLVTSLSPVAITALGWVIAGALRKAGIGADSGKSAPARTVRKAPRPAPQYPAAESVTPEHPAQAEGE
ncbi:MAG: ECF transporter S component [Microbacteriaceae bacterium]